MSEGEESAAGASDSGEDLTEEVPGEPTTEAEPAEAYGWMITENGISKDGREHIITDRYPYDEGIDIFVASEEDAYLAYFSKSEEQIALDYTHDGGETWETVLVDTLVGVGFIYSSFLDEKTGYLLYCSDPAAGMMTKIVYGTQDGGSSFEKICDLSDAIRNYPIEMEFCDGENGMIITQNHGDESYAFRTEDGGRTWNKFYVDVPDGDRYNYIDGAALKQTKDETQTWVLELRGMLNNGEQRLKYCSTDHWETWQMQ